MRKNTGFTIIELIIVLVLVGILAAIAIPRFISLNSSANQSSTNNIAASLSAASASNFAKRTANSSQGTAISNCTQIGPLISGGLPSGYSITSLAISNGASVNCTVNGPGSTTATFIGKGIS